MCKSSPNLPSTREGEAPSLWEGWGGKTKNSKLLTKLKTMKKEIRLMIVDDHKMIRDGIKLMLKNNPEIKLIAEAENGLEAIKYIDNNPTAVDVILMDISMPKLDGIAATKDIKGNHKNIHVLAITMHIEESYINDMMKAGASGYILKESGRDDLIEAI